MVRTAFVVLASVQPRYYMLTGMFQVPLFLSISLSASVNKADFYKMQPSSAALQYPFV